MRILPGLILVAAACAQTAGPADLAAQTARLRALMSAAPRLPLQQTELAIRPPESGWSIEMVSSVAVAGKGVIYVLQRGAQADPVIAVDREGRILRSWGRGMYRIPHSIRVDPAGNIWTIDAASSMVYQFTPEGRKLLEIAVGGQPANPRSQFCGTTDVAFGPNGRIFISDGYANARILEYTAEGKRVREWGAPGTGPGQFRLPHGLAIDRDGVLYVADRENGRIQRFDLNGKYLGEWDHLGKTFSITLTAAGELWIGTQPRNEPNGAPGWLAKIDRRTGRVLGVVESTGHHSVTVNAAGEPLTGTRPDKVLWFRAPGR